VNAEDVAGEVAGIADGTPGLRFEVAKPPIVDDQAIAVEVGDDDGWQPWERVPDFSASGPDDHHVVVDHTTGEILFGPAVREPDGSIRQYGAVPPKGAAARVRYRRGGGAAGNVRRGAITVLKTSIPYITRVSNPTAAFGGRDGETIENAKDRGPIVLRTRNRAVTSEDFEQLAYAATRDVARVRAITGDDGGIRVLVVPHVPSDGSRMAFEQLVPADETLEQIAETLDRTRVVGTRVIIERPTYQGVTVIARIKARVSADPDRLQTRALEALFRYFHPVFGGPDGDGWPFGRPVQAGEVYAVLQNLDGTEYIEDARVFPADPVTGERADATQRLELEPNSLVYSYDHQVQVTT